MYPPKLFFKDRFVAVNTLILAILAIVSWWFILSKVPKNADQVFLHYNIIFGVDLAGSWWKLLMLPGGATAVLVINTIFAWSIFSHDRILAKIVLICGVLASLVALSSLVLIVGLNV